ncbi:MAG: hypothetical protein RIM80_13925 [Alphaproteobacteria bacterium]
MNVAGGLAGAFGSLALDGARGAGAPSQPLAQRAPASAAPAVEKPGLGGFREGLFQARAVNAPAKAQSAMPPPNPNLPRGSLIDLKV